MEEKKYTKLSALVDDTFTVEKAWGYQWKMWDNESKRMLVSEKYEQGYRKIYSLDTDKGKLDVSAGQIGQLLEGVYKNGEADLNGRTFKVKSNGKTGMDIRYFLNATQDAPKQTNKPDVIQEVDDNEEVDLSSIPF